MEAVPFFIKKSLSSSIEPIEIECNRICSMKIITSVGAIYLYNVHMPCDTSNNLYLHQYNKVLSHISTNIQYNNVHHCIVAGDLNTDFTRSDSGITISLTSFLNNENLSSVLQDYKHDIKYTYSSINNSKSLIDHFSVSVNIACFVTKYSILESTDNLSDHHEPLFCYLDCCIDDLPPTIIDDSCTLNKKPLWHSTKDSDIEAYKCTLDNCLPLYSSNACILNSTMPCSCIVPYIEAINNFHDHIIESCKIALSVHIPHTNSGVCKAKIIPGWEYETDCAREESLLACHIWIESGKPDAGIEYDNMKRCKVSYHYLLRSLKSNKDVHVKQSVSKSLFQSSKRNYWKSVVVIRKKNYNTVLAIDNIRGNAAIAELFKDKYATLYISVSYSSISMKALHERIRGKIASQCDTCVNPSLHTHSVSITHVIKAVNHLKSDKYNDDGILMSNNFLHGTHLLYTCIAQLFFAMLCYGFAPRLFLRSTIIPIPNEGRSSSSNFDHFRSIAISSILSNILDYIIIDQQAHSLITSDHQFGINPNSLTVLCTTMLVETVQY